MPYMRHVHANLMCARSRAAVRKLCISPISLHNFIMRHGSARPPRRTAIFLRSTGCRPTGAETATAFVFDVADYNSSVPPLQCAGCKLAGERLMRFIGFGNTKKSEVSRSMRCTIPGRNTPSFPESDFHEVIKTRIYQRAAPDGRIAGWTTIPFGLFTAGRLSSSQTISSGMSSGWASAGTGSGQLTLPQCRPFNASDSFSLSPRRFTVTAPLSISTAPPTAICARARLYIRPAAVRQEPDIAHRVLP